MGSGVAEVAAVAGLRETLIEVKGCSGAWVVKGSRVIVQGILDDFEADETPGEVARMFSLPVATVRRVLHFALSAELAAMKGAAQRVGILRGRKACLIGR